MSRTLDEQQNARVRKAAAASAHTSMTIEGRVNSKSVNVSEAQVSRARKSIVESVQRRRASTP